MRNTRRDFLRAATAAAAAAAGLDRADRLGLPVPLPRPQEAAPAPKKLKLLILGGTMFLGPETVNAALARGHTVTLFNRGKTNPHLFPDLEKLHGDRDGKLDALKGRDWDAVVDPSANVPRWVDLSAGLLKEHVGHYVYISSISVYPTVGDEDTDESTVVGKIDDPTVEKITGTTYGPLKALCEQAAEKAMPGRATSIRPGLIVGPGDPTDRFTYWPVRVKAGGEVLAPGAPDHGVQYIDVRDLGEWIVRVIEDKTFGVFNALGPKEPMPLGGLLKTGKEVAKSDAVFTWADTAFLAEQGVQPWSDMPVWIPPPEGRKTTTVCANLKAVAKGLAFRPAADTVAATLKWWEESRGPEYKLRAGIKREREKEVLAAWHAREKGK